jgi:hypothetical protein
MDKAIVRSQELGDGAPKKLVVYPLVVLPNIVMGNGP